MLDSAIPHFPHKFTAHLYNIMLRRHTLKGRSFSSYAFIGLGRMGYPMAQNLRKSLPPSTELLVYDTNKSASASLASTPGVKVAESLKEIGESSECIITMLPNSEHVEECYLGDKGLCFKQSGILESTNSKKLFIDCSTIDPFRSIKIGEYVKSKKLGTFVDAPVSGGVAGATNAALSFMIGATQSEEIQSVLSSMGKNFHFCGSSGRGLAAKLTNNYLLALNNIATAEAMNLGQRLGLDSKILGAVINSSTGYCWPSQKNNPVLGITPGAPVERDFDGGFGIELMIKDLGLAGAAAEGSGTYLDSYDAALKLYKTVAGDSRHKGKDFGVIIRYLIEKSQDR